jgi:hypothetical protein
MRTILSVLQIPSTFFRQETFLSCKSQPSFSHGYTIQMANDFRQEMIERAGSLLPRRQYMFPITSALEGNRDKKIAKTFSIHSKVYIHCKISLSRLKTACAFV